MQSVKGGIPAGLACPECGKPLMIKFGKAGAFLACSGYPDCNFTSNFSRNEEGKVEAVAAEKPKYEKVGQCHKCGRDLVIKKARTLQHPYLRHGLFGMLSMRPPAQESL